MQNTLLLFGSALTVVGIALLGNLSTTAVHVVPAVYGYELSAVGCNPDSTSVE